MIRAMLLALVLPASANAQTCSDVDTDGHLVIPSGITSIPDVSNALSGSLCSACVPLPAHVHVSFRCHADTPGVDTHQGNTTVRGRAPSVHRARLRSGLVAQLQPASRPLFSHARHCRLMRPASCAQDAPPRTTAAMSTHKLTRRGSAVVRGRTPSMVAPPSFRSTGATRSHPSAL